MGHGVAGAPAAWSVITLALGALLWMLEHHFQRFTAWLFAASAGFAVAGITPWRDALAGLTTTGAGLTVLAVLAVMVFPAFHLQAVRSAKPGRVGRLLAGKKKTQAGPGSGMAVLGGSAPRRNRYHRHFTPLIAMVAGTLVVVILGAWRILAAQAGRSAASAGHALLQSTAKINDGTAAHGVSTSHRPGILLAGAFVLLVAFTLMRGWDKRRKGSRKGGPPVLTGGRS